MTIFFSLWVFVLRTYLLKSRRPRCFWKEGSGLRLTGFVALPMALMRYEVKPLRS